MIRYYLYAYTYGQMSQNFQHNNPETVKQTHKNIIHFLQSGFYRVL